MQADAIPHGKVLQAMQSKGIQGNAMQLLIMFGRATQCNISLRCNARQTIQSYTLQYKTRQSGQGNMIVRSNPHFGNLNAATVVL